MADDRNEKGSQATEEVRLSRSLGLFTVTMMGVGGMIGAGIFALTGIAAGQAGPAVVLVFILNGVVTFLTALAYAELGAAFPKAGGGYVWVKEGLGGPNGFLAGWMSWFGYIVAGALYAIAFGRFASDAWQALDLPAGGLSPARLADLAAVLVVVLFTGLNAIGAKETGALGAVITVVKVVILGLFVLFGALVMTHGGGWTDRFTDHFMPNGAAGVLIAMGLTFIAFEGYEIIAQSGEEIVNPARNVPRGIFLSIAIAVVVYVLVAIVAIGATQPPAGMSVHDYLGQERELAVVVIARQIFPFGTGGALMLISGLAATMSALNVTVYSASRVSFAMAREHNLPAPLARVHPARLTPYIAVLATGVLMLASALTLPLETAATAGSLMFLLMFIQVNLVVITLRHKQADVRRGYRVPLFPLPPLLAIAANSALALYMITFNPTAVWTAFGWIILGLLAYYMHFERQETLEKPPDIVHEEVFGRHDYTVLVGVRSAREATVLGWIGAAIAKARKGGILATHLLEVPQSLSLFEGRRLVEARRQLFDDVRGAAKQQGVATHSVIMLARRVSQAITELVGDRAVDLSLIGVSAKPKRGRVFGRTTDALLAHPPCEVVVVRPAARLKTSVKTILVPVDDNENSRSAVKLAADLGSVLAGRANAEITLLHVVSTKAQADSGQEPLFERVLEGVDYKKLKKEVVVASSVANKVIEAAEAFDLVVFGLSEGSVLQRMKRNRTGRRILRNAKPTAIMVVRRQPALKSLLRQALEKSK